MRNRARPRCPGIATLRSWDRALLTKYHPFYLPFCDLCCLCTMGKCDLSGGKRGACGIDMAAQQSRIVLLACTLGAATHTGHMRHLLGDLIGSFGRDHPLDVGSSVLLEAPHARLVTGIKPKILGDLEDVARVPASRRSPSSSPAATPARRGIPSTWNRRSSMPG